MRDLVIRLNQVELGQHLPRWNMHMPIPKTLPVPIHGQRGHALQRINSRTAECPENPLRRRAKTPSIMYCTRLSMSPLPPHGSNTVEGTISWATLRRVAEYKDGEAPQLPPATGPFAVLANVLVQNAAEPLEDCVESLRRHLPPTSDGASAHTKRR